MSETAGALGYLIARTLKNRVGRQLARVKSPRYALALLLGLAYLWLVFLRPDRQQSLRPTNPGTVITNLGGIGFAITVCWWWLKGGVASGLAFQPAEVQFLFTGPLTRRQVLGYKIVKAQVLLLFNALIWMVLMRRWGLGLTMPMRFVSAWAIFSTLGMHRLAAALTQTSPVTGARKAVYALLRVATAAVAATLLFAVASGLRSGAAGGGAMQAIADALGREPATWALAPFHFIVAPLSAASFAAWLPAVGLVVLVAAGHLLWVLAMAGVPFEEAAASASAELAKKISAFRERRAAGGFVSQPKSVKRTVLPLASSGAPWVAIAWKNTLSLTRMGAVRTILLLVAFAIVAGKLARDGGNAHTFAPAMPFLMLTGMFLLLGPRMVRNDLRQDLLQIALLKTYPISGAKMVAAQMVSPALVLTIIQLAVLLAGVIALPLAVLLQWGAVTFALGIVTVLLALVSLNGATIGIQNGAALMFPSWIRLGPDSGGIEAIGQNLLLTLLSLVALIVALIGPVAAGFVVRTLAENAGPAQWVAAVATGAVALMLETFGMVLALGNVFERTDPATIS